MNDLTKILLTALVWISLTIILTFPVMYLWNYVVVDTFPGVKQLDFIHAWGLFILFNTLTKVEVRWQ